LRGNEPEDLALTSVFEDREVRDHKIRRRGMELVARKLIKVAQSTATAESKTGLGEQSIKNEYSVAESEGEETPGAGA